MQLGPDGEHFLFKHREMHGIQHRGRGCGGGLCSGCDGGFVVHIDVGVEDENISVTVAVIAISTMRRGFRRLRCHPRGSCCTGHRRRHGLGQLRIQAVQGIHHLRVRAAHKTGSKLVQQAANFFAGMLAGLALGWCSIGRHAQQAALQQVGQCGNFSAARSPCQAREFPGVVRCLRAQRGLRIVLPGRDAGFQLLGQRFCGLQEIEVRFNLGR